MWEREESVSERVIELERERDRQTDYLFTDGRN